MESKYLDFVPNKGRDKSFDEDDILVYTKKNKEKDIGWIHKAKGGFAYVRRTQIHTNG